MEKYAAILGFIAVCFADTVQVQVKKTAYNVKPGESVSLSCLGSSNKLEYYINNRLNWDFINAKGQKFSLTKGLYKTSGEAYADAHFGSGHFEHEWSTGDANYIFKLKIKGIVDADDGTYRCSLVNVSSQEVVDYKDVTVTVLHPVEKVTLEIHNLQTHAVLVKKTSPATAKNQAIELWCDAYMVKCVAEGSNPEPEVEFMYNKGRQAVNWKTDKDTSGDRVKYTKQFSEMAFPLQPHDMDQYLTCSANIAMGDYPAKTASIKMVVRIDISNMVCSNTSAKLNDRHVRITCNLIGCGLNCDMVRWIIGNNDDGIDLNMPYGDEQNSKDIMENLCNDLGDRLETSLVFNEVKASNFDTIYYLTYGSGNDSHRLPVQLMQKRGSGTLITPLSLCIYLVLACVTKQAFQRV